jgi:(p)ppGpp synthase/HD superfamily hydrolase
MLQVEQLIERVKAYQPSVDPQLIKRAYDYSFRMHAGQTRK